MSLIIKTKKEKDKIPIASIEHNEKSNYVYVDFDDNSNSEIKQYKCGQGEKINWNPYVLDEQRTAIYISGISGSGKSSFARVAIDKLREQKRFKKNEIYFISLKDCNEEGSVDKCFDGLKGFFPIDVHREDFLSVQWSDFENCIVVFDDYNQLAKKDPLYIHINTLLKKLLELGRKQNVMLIIINHMTQNYNETRNIIFEADTVVLFPRSNLNSTIRFVKSYVSDDKQLLEEITNIKGNQFVPLIIHKTAPQYLMTNKWIKLF
jgi:hypothetical protein